jgi:hypothetical protein
MPWGGNDRSKASAAKHALARWRIRGGMAAVAPKHHVKRETRSPLTGGWVTRSTTVAAPCRCAAREARHCPAGRSCAGAIEENGREWVDFPPPPRQQPPHTPGPWTPTSTALQFGLVQQANAAAPGRANQSIKWLCRHAGTTAEPRQRHAQRRPVIWDYPEPTSLAGRWEPRGTARG